MAPVMHPRPRDALLWTVLLLGAPACAHTDPSSARSAQPEASTEEVARLAARQRQLEARIQRLEDRLRLMDGPEKAISLSAADRTAPAHPPATTVAAPRPTPSSSAEGDGEGIGLFRRPVTLGRKTGEPARTTDGGSDPPVAPTSAAAPRTAGGPSASGDESGMRRSFRLEGRKLVELTQAPPRLAQASPPRKERRSKASRRRKGEDPVITAYHEAMERLRAGDHEAARAAFDRIARRHPRHPYADNALYWKGEAAYDAGDYEAALADFTAVVERYAGGNKAPDALLKIALCYQRLGRTAEAVELMTELIEAYPRAHASDVARIKLVEIRG
ncbi:MAG: tol-pal system protein YbgF [Deltaproteobacteria bacterium]|nr:MAG: tol-pal system protein YbgF [Deltaproteobacteria bacterium]